MAREKQSQSPKKQNFTQRLTSKITGISLRKSSTESLPTSISTLLSYQLVNDSLEISNETPAKPMGLFGLFDNSTSTDDLTLICKNQKFFNQLELFREIFPSFPLSMLKALILRFYGNFKEIANHLIDKGWDSENFELLTELNDKNDVHFTVLYFFGNNSNSKLLLNSQINSYFTFYQYEENTTKYYVKYKNKYGRIEESLISGPDVNPAEFPLLTSPLSRSCDISSSSFFPLLKYIK